MPNQLAKQWMEKVLSVAGQTNTKTPLLIGFIFIVFGPVVVLLIIYPQEQEQASSNSDPFSYLALR